MSCIPSLPLRGLHSHFAPAQVILGLGLGPAICPPSESRKGALGGGPLLRLTGGEQIARPDLFFFLSLRPTSDLIAGARVQSVQWTLRFSADLDPPFARGVWTCTPRI